MLGTIRLLYWYEVVTVPPREWAAHSTHHSAACLLTSQTVLLALVKNQTSRMFTLWILQVKQQPKCEPRPTSWIILGSQRPSTAYHDSLHCRILCSCGTGKCSCTRGQCTTKYGHKNNNLWHAHVISVPWTSSIGVMSFDSLGADLAQSFLYSIQGICYITGNLNGDQSCDCEPNVQTMKKRIIHVRCDLFGRIQSDSLESSQCQRSRPRIVESLSIDHSGSVTEAITFPFIKLFEVSIP